MVAEKFLDKTQVRWKYIRTAKGQERTACQEGWSR